MSESPLPANKPIEEADLLNLITVKARENRFIEFKSEYLPQTDSGKKKFLQSVASFANATGGDLVLGMREADGVASALAPLTDLDPDQARLQILDLIRVHLRPALGGIEVVPVGIGSGGHLIVVRVPKSWAGPHMLTYGDDRRFYIRGDGGKRPMDYEDVRDGFLASDAIAARIRNFRMERCAAILNGETPRRIVHQAKVVLHMVPYGSLQTPHRFETRQLQRVRDKLRPLRHYGYGHGFDLDGVYAFGSQGEKAYSYATLFRSGAIEGVDASWLHGNDNGIPYVVMEPELVRAVEGYLDIFRSLDVAPPFAVLVSLLNVRGYFLPADRYYMDSGSPINRDHLFLPEVTLESFPSSVPKALFPVFSSIWNACDLSQSRNYDQEGNWKLRA